MKALFPRAHSKAIEVNVNFNGGDSNTDGLFDLNIDYKLTHADGDGDETGTLAASRSYDGNMWTSVLKTKTTHNIAGPIIPTAISNLDLKIESDRLTKFDLVYTNPSKNRNIQVHASREPGQWAKIQTINGDRVSDLTFKVKDFDLKNIDGNFEIDVDGKLANDPVKGTIKGEANSKGNRIKIDMEKGNKKLVQVNLFVIKQKSSFNHNFHV